jgi:hypothetical protein
MRKLILILITGLFLSNTSYGATIKELLEGKHYGKCGALASNESLWARGDFSYIAFDDEYFYTNYDSKEKKFVTAIKLRVLKFNKSMLKSSYQRIILSPGTNSAHEFNLLLEFNKEDGLLTLYFESQGTWKFMCEKINKRDLPKSKF